MKFKIDCTLVSGNNDRILKEEKYCGIAEFVPLPNGSGLLVKPVEVYIKTNEENRNRGLLEILPLSKYDILKRSLLSLSKRDTEKLYLAKPGETINLIRKGWGKTWEHTVTKEGEKDAEAGKE